MKHPVKLLPFRPAIWTGQDALAIWVIATRSTRGQK